MPNIHATRVPTLLIGVGGIGGEIVRGVAKELKDYDRQYVEFLILDTDTNYLSVAQDESIPYIQTSENNTVKNYLELHPDYQKWFPQNPHINGKILTQGAGQIRSVSRLGALASEEAGRFQALKEALDKISQNHGDPMVNSARVMIVGSICGGTGSGLGIQLPFLVREYLSHNSGNTNAIVRSLFITPQLVEEVQTTEATKRSVNVNGYAFLKEYNAFNVAQETFDEPNAAFKNNNLQIEHYTNPDYSRPDSVKVANQTPYNFMFLIEKSDAQGRNIGSFDRYVQKAVEIVKSQLFTPIQHGQFSAEDNQIIDFVDNHGMSRFCGAGVSKAYYPFEEIKRYCLLRYSNRLLDSAWTLLDRRIKKKEELQERTMASMSGMAPLDTGEEYIRLFDEQVDPSKFDVSPEFVLIKNELNREADIVDEEGNEEHVIQYLPEELFNGILDYIDQSFMTEELQLAISDTHMDMTALKNPDDAPNEAKTKLDSLIKLTGDMEERVNSLVTGCTEQIFPTDMELALSDENDRRDFDIFHALHSLHPIAARYLLYSLKQSFGTELEASKAKLTSIKNTEKVSGIFNRDFYKEGKPGEPKENPVEALACVNPGFLSRFTSFRSGKYNDLIEEINRVMNEELLRAETKHKTKLRVYILQNLLSRIDILIKLYEDFFGNLEKIQAEKREEIAKMEADTVDNLAIRDVNGDTKICADSVCKKHLFEKFNATIKLADTVALPQEAKSGFFEKIFAQFINEYKKQNGQSYDAVRTLSEAELFEEGILTPLVKKFDKAQYSIIDLDILQAIDTEYAIYCNEEAQNSSADTLQSKGAAQYFKEICVSLKTKSTPYLSYQSGAGLVSCYWGINNAVAANHQHRAENDIDKDMLKNMFGPTGGATYSAVCDDSFSKYELTCYSSIYGLSIENLTKYSKDGHPYECYSERISRVVNKSFSLGTSLNRDSFLDTVHPHLDKRWHAHAYLPELFPEDEAKMKDDTNRAFIYALGRDHCKYSNIDTVNRWRYRLAGKKTEDNICVGEQLLTAFSYYALYRAFDENAVIVTDALKDAEEEIKRVYNDVRITGITLDQLTSHSLIKGLIGKKLADADKEDLDEALLNAAKYENDTINILDVLFTIYSSSGAFETCEVLVETLETILLEYCLKMTNGLEGTGANLADQLKKCIGSNCVSVDKFDDAFRSLCRDFF